MFLAHGKFVVLSAHRLVHIGDTVHRNVTRNDVRTRVLQCANALNEALGQTVSKTKQAAQFFPSVSAVQEMVDSVVDVSHLAKDLKVAMIHAAQQPWASKDQILISDTKEGKEEKEEISWIHASWELFVIFLSRKKSRYVKFTTPPSSSLDCFRQS